jgi:hypothetical protein
MIDDLIQINVHRTIGQRRTMSRHPQATASKSGNGQSHQFRDVRDSPVIG